jgi:hypothetical protein
VIAHEVGHHVQNLLGVLPKAMDIQRSSDKASANHVQVMVELQADCFAGIWANHSQAKWKFIEPGDVEAALQTAAAIGDDRLQQQSRGYVVPDSFTHGSSAQRARWFSNGLKSGAVSSCNTFEAGSAETRHRIVMPAASARGYPVRCVAVLQPCRRRVVSRASMCRGGARHGSDGCLAWNGQRSAWAG